MQILLKQLGDIEDEVFKNRIANDNNYKKRQENKKIMKRRILNNKNNKHINDINLNECKLSDEYDENEMN